MDKCLDITSLDESLPEQTYMDLSSLGITEAVLLCASGNFYRTNSNSNITIDIPLGTDISPGSIYLSPDVYLPINSYNDTKTITEVNFPENRDVSISADLQFKHSIMIQYKLEKGDTTNYKNNRGLRAILVKADGTSIYDASLFSEYQPVTGEHNTLLMEGCLTHSIGDLIKIKFSVVQDVNKSDQSSSYLTIFRITWNILGLKNE